MNESPQKGINTTYESVFKNIIKKCPRLTLFLINEMFYKKDLIDEEYDGTEKVMFLDKELTNLRLIGLGLDMRVAVTKRTRLVFHLECKSTADGTVILRMVRYDTRSTLEEKGYKKSNSHVKLEEPGVLFLRNAKTPPEMMTVIMEAPQGGTVSYRIPVVNMQDYTVDYILEQKLFILLPFIFFNYEDELRGAPSNKVLYEKILNLYDTILSKLMQLTDARIITAFEARTLYNALKTVFEALGKTNKAEKEVEDVMGGKVLEFSADKYYYAGKEEGFAEARAEAQKETANLMAFLVKRGRVDEIIKASTDECLLEQLFVEYRSLTMEK